MKEHEEREGAHSRWLVPHLLTAARPSHSVSNESFQSVVASYVHVLRV